MSSANVTSEHLAVCPVGSAITQVVEIAGSWGGPLGGRRFGVKDVIDVAGLPTTAGSPAWAASHPVPEAHAPVVGRLLMAGATLVGKTMSDELAFSVNGTNPHYGMPPNPAAPGHVPGGSSSGSASAAAAGDVDFALGTDTGGSVRVPASYCGVLGIRPSVGLTQVEGVVPLAPSFDTVGWFAKDFETMRLVGEALLPEATVTEPPARLVLFAEALDIARGDVAERFLTTVRSRFGDRVVGPRRLGLDLRRLASIRYLIQTYETWQVHGEWAKDHLEQMGPGVRARLEQCAATTSLQYDAACEQRERIRRMLDSSVGNDEILCLPTTPTPAPSVEELRAGGGDRRADVFALGAVAGLWGGPEVSVPAARVGGLPLGLSLLGHPGDDHRMLQFLSDSGS